MFDAGAGAGEIGALQFTSSTGLTLLSAWLGLTSFVAFALFGYDKWQAGRRGGRVSESTLCCLSALGGWPGGLLGILVFRHKSAKGSFQFKFALAFIAWAALLYATWRWAPAQWSRSEIAADNDRAAAESPRFPAGSCT
jgi:uncharacterized membrane protein YsdA (DUF1294 family)